MKAMKSCVVWAACALAVGGASAAELSYNLGVVSLYKSNGVDQDYDKADATGLPFNDAIRPAIQGGVDVDLGHGFYVGNWNSTGTFEKANLEVDLYGGYARELANGLAYDVGYAHYAYPGMSSWNGGELVFKVSFAGFGAKLTHGVNGSLKADNGDAKQRFALSYDYSVNDKTSLNVTYGKRNQAGGDFADYAVGVSYDLGDNMSLSATYSGATKKAEADNGERNNRLVIGFGKSF